jgi:uncharacterized protein (DUF885 family)
MAGRDADLRALIGRLEIMRLREQPRAALGAKFDIRRFHDRVLEDGTVPLPLIKAKIERWIPGGRR